MIKSVFAIAMVVAVFTFQQAPSSDAVAAMFLKHEFFAQIETMPLRLGASCVLPPSNPMERADQDKRAALVKGGLLSRETVGASDGPKGPADQRQAMSTCWQNGGAWTTLDLTAKGKAASKDWKQSGDVQLIPVGQRHLDRIVSVTMKDAATARVEFMWSLDVSEYGKIIGYLAMSRPGAALLNLINGTWTVSGIM